MRPVTAVIISKPHHLINSLNLLQQLKIKKNIIFVICNSFNGSKDLAQNLSCLDNWNIKAEIIFEPNRMKATSRLKDKNVKLLLSDSDVGLRHHIAFLVMKLRHRKLDISLYEEGWGPYFLKVESIIKIFFLDILKAGKHFGGSYFTKSIYLYDPDVYKTNFPLAAEKAVLLKNTFEEYYRSEKNLLDNIFPIKDLDFLANEKVRESCVIYLTDKHFDFSMLPTHGIKNADHYIKFHPGLELMYDIDNWYNLSSHISAELYLMKLKDSYSNITVYHHKSSVTRYLSDDCFNFIDLGK